MVAKDKFTALYEKIVPPMEKYYMKSMNSHFIINEEEAVGLNEKDLSERIAMKVATFVHQSKNMADNLLLNFLNKIDKKVKIMFINIPENESEIGLFIEYNDEYLMLGAYGNNPTDSTEEKIKKTMTFFFYGISIEEERKKIYKKIVEFILQNSGGGQTKKNGGGKQTKKIGSGKQNKKIGSGQTYTKNVSEPWFTLIKLGLKTVEGRLNKGDFANFKPDDIVIFTNSDFGKERRVQTQIKAINKYATFGEYLVAEKMSKCLPGIDDLTDGIAVYRKYFTEEDEKKYGILAIQLKTTRL
jgi:ASC-1-like (ASCH) protein